MVPEMVIEDELTRHPQILLRPRHKRSVSPSTRTFATLEKRGADDVARATSGADGRAQPGGAPGQRAQAPRDTLRGQRRRRPLRA